MQQCSRCTCFKIKLEAVSECDIDTRDILLTSFWCLALNLTRKSRESNKDADEGMKERLAAAKDESPKSPQRRGRKGW